MLGTLFVVATPIGNLEDITLRALRILGEADLIAAEDTRHTAKLLSHHGISTRTTSLFAHNEQQKIGRLLDRLRAGDRIALVSDAGTPTISDPGCRLVAAAMASGFRVEPIPGPSAVMTSLSASGFPADRFRFEGFAPRKVGQLRAWLRELATVQETIVFLDAPHRIQRTLDECASILGNRQIIVARELTKLHEELVKGPTPDVVKAITNWRGEFTVVIGPGKMATQTDSLDEATVRAQFVQLTENHAMTRRQAVRTMAQELAISTNELYEIIERTKE